MVEGLELVVAVNMFGQPHLLKVDLLLGALVRPLCQQHLLLLIWGLNHVLAFLVVFRKVCYVLKQTVKSLMPTQTSCALRVSTCRQRARALDLAI